MDSSPGRVRKLLVLSFLFTSGATGLVYQLVWSRYLANLLGNSGQAHSVVVATFMGGLALGAWLFGRMADRAKKPLAVYGALELGVAVYALLFPWVLKALGAAYLALAPGMPEGARIVPKLLLAASSLVIPTLLMGGTLPALARHFTSQLSAVQKEVAKLYAVNSLGAAFGAFLAGVRAVPDFGLMTSSRVAAAANLVLALGALALARKEAPLAESAAASGPPPREYPASAARAALIGVSLTGFTSMLLEMSWIRVLTLTLGASTYAFTLILSSFILGIGLGSFWLARRKNQDGDGLKLFARLQFAQVAAICLAVPLYTRLPFHFWQARAALNPTLATWPIYQAVTFAFCAGVLLIPTFFMGAAFPAAARVATSNVKELGRQLGGVYLWNTLGTISGAALGGLVLMPAIGVEGNFVLGITVTLATGLLAWWFSPTRGAVALKQAWPAAGSVAIVLVFVVFARGWSIDIGEAGTFRSNGPPPPDFASFKDVLHHVDGHPVELRFHKDDTFATISVGEVPKTGLKFLRLNGKVDASNASDMETMILTGHLGMLLHPREVKNVLIIGAGSGVTAGSVLQHPGVQNVDLVEISPAMLEAARFFDQENLHAFEDPRLHVHVEDAKTFMALAGKTYDLIISEPSNPWVAGVSGLFTREFFQAAAAHLTDDGMLVQWIHAYESDQEMIRLVMRSLRETFPHSTTWLGPIDILFAASRKSTSLDFATLEQRMAQPKVQADLARIHLSTAYALLGKQIHSEAGQVEFAGKGEINTDDQNILEYAAPIGFYLRRRVTVQDERYGPDGGARLYLARYAAQHPPTSLELGDLYRNLAEGHPPGDPLRRTVAQKWYASAPDDLDAALAEATEATFQWDFAAADEALAKVMAEPSRRKGAFKTWLELEARRANRLRTSFHAQHPFDAAVAAEALAQSAADPALREPAERFCRVVRTHPCPQPPEITAEAASSR